MSPILGGPGDMSPLRHFQLSKSLAKSAATKRRGKLMDDKDFQALELGEFVCFLYCYMCRHIFIA